MAYKQRTVRPLADRFWERVKKTATCWLWTGATNGVGYGLIGKGRAGEGNAYAHRVSWEIHFGPIPAGLYVCHSCDNPPCVRPDHLFVASNSQNIIDARDKGRLTRQHGTGRPNAKLTDADVAEIRRLGALCNTRGGRRMPDHIRSA